MTVGAFLIPRVAEPGLLRLALQAAHAQATARDRPRRRLRAAFHWYACGLVHSILLGVAPTLRPVSGDAAGLGETGAGCGDPGAGGAGWIHPIGVMMRRRADAV